MFNFDSYGSSSFKVLYSQDEIPKADVTIKAIGYQWYWGMNTQMKILFWTHT